MAKGSKGKSPSQPINKDAKIVGNYGPSQRVGQESRYKKNFDKEGNLCPDTFSKM